MNKVFHGAWPALVTPATADGGVNMAVLNDLVAWLLEKKVDGLYLCGGTGEGLLLPPADRCAVVESVMAQVDGRIPIIVHVGSINTREAAALAAHAQQTGADGVSSVLPVYLGGLDATYRHYAALAAAAPGLPFFPYLFGGQIDAVSLMRELLCRIPSVCGAKYTSPNMFELAQIIELGDAQQHDKSWTIFSGMDEQCLFGLMMGAPGNIGTTLNVMPGPYRLMRASYEAGDSAQALDLQKRANRLTAVMIEHGVAAAMRVALKLIGFDCGDPRLPQEPVTPEKEERVAAELEEAGLTALAAM
ncbi:MAG: dihydrodipicolinate synthase family protein [Caldilineaceae bacterium]|nr:dihydrodipicolinate synthase family protein [Caldilineaceae bacterium]